MEYAAGTLDLAKSIAVNAHLHYCPTCRQNLYAMEQLGGALLEKLTPTDIDESCFDNVLERIEHYTNERTKAHVSEPVEKGNNHIILPRIIDQDDPQELPAIVKQLVSAKRPLKWQRLGNALKVARLSAGQTTHEIALHRINAGGKTFEHDHKGQELTVVLKGSFSDEDGMYQQGDFIFKQPGDVHRPLAAKHEDCLCLTVLEAPVALTGIFTRLLNPFQRIHAA